MQANNPQVRQKQLGFLKMRVEMIAWRIQEIGMSPEIRSALPESTLQLMESMLFETGVPDPQTLTRYEQIVCETEQQLAQTNRFWRSGNETIH